MHKRCQTAQRHIFHRLQMCKYIQVNSQSNLLHNIEAKMAYFNTTVTTNRMANTRNVTFKQPHTRQIQFPKPSLLLPTISFTLFRFSSKLSILSTSSGMFVVEAAPMVEEEDGRYPLSLRNTTYSSWNQNLEHVPGTHPDEKPHVN